MKSQGHYDKVFSFEFFPPKTDDGVEKLNATREKLAALKPKFFSVTFGAGGSTRDRTYDAVKAIQQAGHQAAPHISCIASSKDSVRKLLSKYQALGIKHLVTLRGDIPSGMGGTPGEFQYASELVAFIRTETGDHFHIEVAAYPEFHPQAASAQSDLEYFKRKVEAGANAALTQYFYNPDAYFSFVESCEKMGLALPIVPGIMPITNCTQLTRFSDACGAEIPRWIRQRLEGFGDDMDSLRAFGMDVTTGLCEKLLDGGAPGLHFYAMNRSEPSTEIWKRLGLS
ncbi:MAG TPA: methylenetetrahydrofolate reductase [NAD(P)H] [Acidiferrobacteraceae bacterium]|nr:methylenetetrahydrofolate reductase [NAD(P)H] [Acidiferrobacteraceae bacterium]